MWTSIKPVLAQIFTSKKALYTFAGIIVWLFAKADILLTPDDALPVLTLVGMLVFGQGIADFGKEAKKLEVSAIEKARAETPEKP